MSADTASNASRGWRILVPAMFAVTLAGCGVAPGMHMDDTATVPVSAATEPLQVSVSDIDLALIRQLRDEAARKPMPTGAELFAPPRPYTLGAGDVLQIVVWDHPELAAAQGAQGAAQARAADAPLGFVVDEAGHIQFPYAGSIEVAGLSASEVHGQLVQRLSRVYREPQVTVRVASFRAKQVYVDGEVRTPGAQTLNDIPMTLYEAVSRAGGFSPAADQSRMVLVRRGVSHPIDLARLLVNQQDPARIVLEQGDMLRVQSRDESGVFVMGELNRPVTALPMKTGKLTLADALSQAGSLNASSADAAKLYVIRGARDNDPRVYRLDASSPVSMLLASQFDLLPSDVVYVDSTGLARVSRVLAQLLPAINAGLTAAVVTQ